MTPRSLGALGLLAALAVAPVPSAAGTDSGAEIYRAHCARCHGPSGVPDLPGTPDFTRGEGLRTSDLGLMSAIRRGIGTMPGFDDQLENEDLIDVLFYIRTLER